MSSAIPFLIYVLFCALMGIGVKRLWRRIRRGPENSEARRTTESPRRKSNSQQDDLERHLNEITKLAENALSSGVPAIKRDEINRTIIDQGDLTQSLLDFDYIIPTRNLSGLFSKFEIYDFLKTASPPTLLNHPSYSAFIGLTVALDAYQSSLISLLDDFEELAFKLREHVRPAEEVRKKMLSEYFRNAKLKQHAWNGLKTNKDDSVERPILSFGELGVINSSAIELNRLLEIRSDQIRMRKLRNFRRFAARLFGGKEDPSSEFQAALDDYQAAADALDLQFDKSRLLSIAMGDNAFRAFSATMIGGIISGQPAISAGSSIAISISVIREYFRLRHERLVGEQQLSEHDIAFVTEELSASE